MFTWWQGILAVIATIVIYLIVVFVSSHTGGVQVWLDGTLLPLGIVGQILMTYGYRSQWVAWIILDVIKVVIWFNQLSAGGPGAMSMFVLQVVMLANGFYGAWVWFHKSSTMAVSDDLQSSICTESIIAMVAADQSIVPSRVHNDHIGCWAGFRRQNHIGDTLVEIV